MRVCDRHNTSALARAAIHALFASSGDVGLGGDDRCVGGAAARLMPGYHAARVDSVTALRE